MLYLSGKILKFNSTWDSGLIPITTKSEIVEKNNNNFIGFLTFLNKHNTINSPAATKPVE